MSEGKYKRKPRESMIEQILADPNLSPENKIAKSLMYLESFMFELEDSTQLAIFEIDEDLKKANASSRVSM